MTRTILVHLSVSVDDHDQRDPDEIADEILDRIKAEPGNARHHFCVSSPLAEELQPTP